MNFLTLYCLYNVFVVFIFKGQMSAAPGLYLACKCRVLGYFWKMGDYFQEDIFKEKNSIVKCTFMQTLLTLRCALAFLFCVNVFFNIK